MPVSEKPKGKLTARKTSGKDQKKKEIPKEFMNKIKRLGMRDEDAEVLYDTKIDWTAVYSENKIHCVEPGCNFSTKIDSDDLNIHMKEQHKYGEYPCTHSHCHFIGYSEVQKSLICHT